MGFTVRSPGSWRGGSWVSALLIDGLFLHLHCDLAVMFGWLNLLIAKSFFNSSAHKLPSSTEHVLSTGCFVSLCWLCFLFCFWCFRFGFCLFVLFALVDCTPAWTTLDRVMVRALFRLPNAGTCSIVHNSFNGTNTVLRLGESREGEGRKKETSGTLAASEGTLTSSNQYPYFQTSLHPPVWIRL